jgi:hypothetical protein
VTQDLAFIFVSAVLVAISDIFHVKVAINANMTSCHSNIVLELMILCEKESCRQATFSTPLHVATSHEICTSLNVIQKAKP